jgi:hypothetical protein
MPQQGSAALIYAQWHPVFEFAGFDAPPAPRASLVRREIQIRVHRWHAVRQTGRRESPCRVLRLAGCTKAPPAPLGCRADKLQIELATLRTAEDLVAWATLPTENSLQTADAQAVEEDFEAKRRALEALEPPADSRSKASNRRARPRIRP